MYSIYSTYIARPLPMLRTRDSLAIITGTTKTSLAVPENSQVQLIAQEEPEEERPEI